MHGIQRERRIVALLIGFIIGAGLGLFFNNYSLLSAVWCGLITGVVAFLMEFFASKGIYTSMTIGSKKYYEEEQEKLEQEFYDSMKQGLATERDSSDEEFEI